MCVLLHSGSWSYTSNGIDNFTQIHTLTTKYFLLGWLLGMTSLVGSVLTMQYFSYYLMAQVWCPWACSVSEHNECAEISHGVFHAKVVVGALILGQIDSLPYRVYSGCSIVGLQLGLRLSIQLCLQCLKGRLGCDVSRECSKVSSTLGLVLPKLVVCKCFTMELCLHLAMWAGRGNLKLWILAHAK